MAPGDRRIQEDRKLKITQNGPFLPAANDGFWYRFLTTGFDTQ
jgi:hypothetical protein